MTRSMLSMQRYLLLQAEKNTTSVNAIYFGRYTTAGVTNSLRFCFLGERLEERTDRPTIPNTLTITEVCNEFHLVQK